MFREPKKIRTPEASYDVLEPETVIDIYVDGFVSIAMSPAVVRLDLFTGDDQFIEDGQQVERRTLRYRLRMPSAAWIEMCNKSLSSFASQYEQLKPATVTYYEALLEMLPKPATNEDKK